MLLQKLDYLICQVKFDEYILRLLYYIQMHKLNYFLSALFLIAQIGNVNVAFMNIDLFSSWFILKLNYCKLYKFTLYTISIRCKVCFTLDVANVDKSTNLNQ